jgi:hypothetical protein
MKMNASVFVVRSFRLTIAAVAAVIISACSEPLAPGAVGPSTFPSLVPSSSAAEIVEKQRSDATFPLLNGSLRAVLTEGSSTVGTIGGGYSGTSSNASSGRETATLGVRIRQKTGVVSGVTTVKADGSGAFTGEGEFTLSLSLVTSEDRTVVTKVRGTSAISCTAEGRIRVTMTGTGSAPRLGTVSVQLQHEVGNTNCF